MNETVQELNDGRNLLLQKMNSTEKQKFTNDAQKDSKQNASKESSNSQLKNQKEQVQQNEKKTS